MRKQELEIVFPIGKQELSATRLVVSEVLSSQITDRTLMYSDHLIAKSELIAEIEDPETFQFQVETDDYLIDFGVLPNYRQSVFHVAMRNSFDPNWKRWMEPVFRSEVFVQAWVSDKDYYFWQNAKSILQYEAANRSHESLPKKSNGLPPPLEQTVIDVSQNPCRRELRTGYVAAIGNPMWLGPYFWRYARGTKDELKSELRSQLTELGTTWQIEMACGSFVDSSTESEQMFLRDLLYDWIETDLPHITGPV